MVSPPQLLSRPLRLRYIPIVGYGGALAMAVSTRWISAKFTATRSAHPRAGYPPTRNDRGHTALMTKYATVPMSLADACLVRMTELNSGSTVLTLDRDFRVYRRTGRHVVPVIAPDA
jgi:hypothetical protein